MGVIGIVFFWLTHLALVALNRGLAASEGPAYLLLSPQTAIWWFFPGFGALSLSWELTLVIWSTIGNQKEADLYDAWSSRKAGFDSRRVLRLMALFIAAPIGLLTCLALPIHDTLHDGEIRTTGFAWRNRSVYRYSDARRLTMIEGFRRLDCPCSSPKQKLILDPKIRARTAGYVGIAESDPPPILLEATGRILRSQPGAAFVAQLKRRDVALLYARCWRTPPWASVWLPVFADASRQCTGPRAHPDSRDSDTSSPPGLRAA